MFVLTVLASLRPIGLDRDSESYSNLVLSVQQGYRSIEPSFIFISEFSTKVFGDDNVRVTLAIYAILNLLLIYFAIAKSSTHKLFSISIYVLLFYTLLTFTQIRFGVSCGLLLLSLKDVSERNLKGFMVKIAIATLFHYLSIIYIFIYFISTKRVKLFRYILFVLFSFLLSSQLTSLAQLILEYANYLPDYLSIKINSYLRYRVDEFKQFNLINSLSIIVLTFLTIICFSMKRLNLTALDVLCIKVMSIGVGLFAIFSFFPTLSIRFLNISGLMLIFVAPSLIRVFPGRPQQLISILFVLFIFLLYFIKINFFNGLLNIDY